MNRIGVWTLSLIVVTLAACGQRTEKAPGILLNEASVNSDGSCTENFLVGYSRVYEAHSQVRIATHILDAKVQETERDNKDKVAEVKLQQTPAVVLRAKVMVEACEEFLAAHPNISCSAYLRGIPQKQMINSDSVKVSCNEVKAKHNL